MLADAHRKAAEDIKAAADWWEALDLTRQAAWYGGEPDPVDAHKALSLLEQIRLWATQ